MIFFIVDYLRRKTHLIRKQFNYSQPLLSSTSSERQNVELKESLNEEQKETNVITGERDLKIQKQSLHVSGKTETEVLKMS